LTTKTLFPNLNLLELAMTTNDRRVALEMIANRPSRRRPLAEILQECEMMADGTRYWEAMPLLAKPRGQVIDIRPQRRAEVIHWKFVCVGMVLGYMLATFAAIGKFRGWF
jgi:hypothetical protein